MSLKTRLIVFVLILFVCGWADWYVTTVLQPCVSMNMALSQVNGHEEDYTKMRSWESCKSTMYWTTTLISLLSALLLFGPRLKRLLGMAAIVLGLFCLPGCNYDTPEYAMIEPNETGFLLLLEAETEKQVKFDSESYLETRKVAAKRIQISHRWNQTGSVSFLSGEWIPTVRLVKVNRSPVTREWTHKMTTGTSAADEAIKVESKDSVGFSIGMTCTAMIEEANSSKFLYYYPSGSLAQVMDGEIRGRVQMMTSDEAAKYDLDAVRGKKVEIMEIVRKDVVTYYQQRGITITSLGMVSGLTYDNPKIQEAIDETVKKQQLKVIAQAEYDAQQKVNDRIQLEAEGVAMAARNKAKGEADAKLTLATAEAEGIRQINKALQEAQQNPALLQLKQIEVEHERVLRWNGAYPQMMFGNQPSLLLPTPPLK